MQSRSGISPAVHYPRTMRRQLVLHRGNVNKRGRFPTPPDCVRVRGRGNDQFHIWLCAQETVENFVDRKVETNDAKPIRQFTRPLAMTNSAEARISLETASNAAAPSRFSKAATKRAWQASAPPVARRCAVPRSRLITGPMSSRLICSVTPRFCPEM